MSFFVAITGKGGVGKTTLSALLVRALIDQNKSPVLAIDADPNSCLDAALGVTVQSTVGSAREEVRQAVQQGTQGLSKQELLQFKIDESLVESDGFDLIAMGRPEGPGCYCYANNVLKSIITKIAGQYPYVVLDNEAGLENLSRRIVQKVNLLVLVSDASSAGLATLFRLHALAKEMNIGYDKLLLVVNRLSGDALPAKATEIAKATGADALLDLPQDLQIAQFAEEGKSILSLPNDNPVVIKVNSLIQSMFG